MTPEEFRRLDLGQVIQVINAQLNSTRQPDQDGTLALMLLAAVIRQIQDAAP